VSTLLGVAFGHYDLQTLLRQTSFCGDFSEKERIPINYDARRSLLNNTEQTVANIDPETLRKVARNTLKGWMLVFEKVMDIFSICCKAVL
jgi:hypothetical protein